MPQQCPECGAAVDDAPWCGACGARLVEATAGSADEAADPGRVRRMVLAAAVVAVIVVIAFGASGGDPTPQGTGPIPGASGVPVEEAEVVAPSLPAPGVARRQFAVSGRVLGERQDLPVTGSATSSLVSDGAVVTVFDSGEPVLAVDATTGEDVAARASTARPDDRPAFVVDGEDLEVDVDEETLRGVVGDEAVWQLVLDGPPAAGPVRTGTSLLLALSTGEVVALAPADGSQRWRRDLGSAATAVAGDGTMLLVGTRDGRVLRLDPSGTPVTTVQVGEQVVHGLAVGRPAAALLVDRLVGFDVAG